MRVFKDGNISSVGAFTDLADYQVLYDHRIKRGEVRNSGGMFVEVVQLPQWKLLLKHCSKCRECSCMVYVGPWIDEDETSDIANDLDEPITDWYERHKDGPLILATDCGFVVQESLMTLERLKVLVVGPEGEDYA